MSIVVTDGTETNYPDILGYITGGARYNANVAQIALAVRPRVVRAGRPFEAILLIQNASDVDVDVTATLQLPDADAKKKPRRFLTQTERLVVGLRPAEVGYVTLPLSCLPDTAVSDGYRLGMAVEVKPLSKPQRVRAPEGGGQVVLEYLADENVTRLNDLKKLTFSTARRGLMGTVIETGFSVMSAQVGQLVDLKPGWVSLWKMSDYQDDRLLFARYRDALKTQVLPVLKRDQLYEPLRAATARRFQHPGLDIQPVEIHYITKLLVALLEMGNPADEAFDPLVDPFYNVAMLLRKGLASATSPMPSWFRGMMKAIDREATTAATPVQALSTTLYDELLRDGLRHGFSVVIQSTGEDLGSTEEIKSYSERLIANLSKADSTLSFTDIYLPLVMAGVILYDRAVLPDEQLGESLMELLNLLDRRREQIDESNEPAFQLAERLVDRALQKYGYHQ